MTYGLILVDLALDAWQKNPSLADSDRNRSKQSHRPLCFNECVANRIHNADLEKST